MGYYATLTGTISFENVLDEKTFEEIEKLASGMFECECTREYIPEPGREAVTSINIDDWDKFWSDEVLESLNALSSAAPILHGEVYFLGEDDRHIRFIYKCGEWVKERGDVIYGEAPLPFEYMAAAIRRFTETQFAISDSAAVYDKLTKEFGFTYTDLRIIGLDWLLKLSGAEA